LCHIKDRHHDIEGIADERDCHKGLENPFEENPSLLRRPIILEGKRMQIGFNEDEIRAFLPRGYRKQELRDATLRAEIE